MDQIEIMNAIGSVGFPIVACGALFWMINTTMKELTGAINQLTSTIRDGYEKEATDNG